MIPFETEWLIVTAGALGVTTALLNLLAAIAKRPKGPHRRKKGR